MILVGWVVALCALIVENYKTRREDKLIQAAESVELALGAEVCGYLRE